MTTDKVKTGLAFHCHHDQLYEYVTDYADRVKYIEKHKPESERALRLRLFRLIPPDRIPGSDSPEWKAYDKAGEAYDKAGEAYEEKKKAYVKAAWEAYVKAWKAYGKAGEAYGKAGEAYEEKKKAYVKERKAYVKAGKAYGKAKEAYDKAWGHQIEELHKELCPDCPWDGSTIIL